MNRFEKTMILFVFTLFFSISYAVLKTARGEIEYIKESKERVHLPSECEQYYNDGTTQWIECMGVGYQ